jgi:hypothetical protein
VEECFNTLLTWYARPFRISLRRITDFAGARLLDCFSNSIPNSFLTTSDWSRVQPSHVTMCDFPVQASPRSHILHTHRVQNLHPSSPENKPTLEHLVGFFAGAEPDAEPSSKDLPPFPDGKREREEDSEDCPTQETA